MPLSAVELAERPGLRLPLALCSSEQVHPPNRKAAILARTPNASALRARQNLAKVDDRPPPSSFVLVLETPKSRATTRMRAKTQSFTERFEDEEDQDNNTRQLKNLKCGVHECHTPSRRITRVKGRKGRATKAATAERQRRVSSLAQDVLWEKRRR
jgi:hypothetical protein